MGNTKFSVAVLAGGQSRRFGEDKTLAKINGRSITSLLTERMKVLSSDVMVVSKDKNKFTDIRDVNLIMDVYKTQCPLVGIITALAHAKYSRVFVVSADTPFVKVELVKFLAEKEKDVVLPVTGGKVHTLCGIYSDKILNTLNYYFEKHIYRILDILDEADTEYVGESDCLKYDSDLISFININTKKDFEYAKKYIKEVGGTL